MSSEHFYRIFDRDAIEPLLSLTWSQFLDRYEWCDTSEWPTAAVYLNDHALDIPHDDQVVARILARRTLRWTMERCSPQAFFIEEIIACVPDVEARCPTFECDSLSDSLLILAAAVPAWLDRRITTATLGAVVALAGSPAELDSLQITDEPLDRALTALARGRGPAPILHHQRGDFPGQDFTGLGPADTRRFFDFLIRAHREVWPCLPLTPDLHRDLPRAARKRPTLRHSSIAFALAPFARRRSRAKGTCLLRFFSI